MAIDFSNTFALMQTLEKSKAPASFLLDTFFPVTPTPSVQNYIAVEYRKGGRRLAPFVVKGARGVNLDRTGSKVDIYQPPTMAASRVINPEDIETRGFGENIYSTMTPAERARVLQAKDLRELQDSIINRKNKMAADILTTGKTVIKGYADDGKEVITDTVAFDWTQEAKVAKSWADAGATIFDDIKAASEQIQESAGEVPTIMICGKNVADYILNNDQIMKWLAIPSASNLSLMGLQPRITSPQVMRIGMIQSLNLEVYSYAETYTDDDGTVKPFLDPNDVIIAIPGRGRQLHAAVTLLNDSTKSFETFASAYVPQYSTGNNQLALTVYSRCVLAPEFVDDWAVIHTTTTA